MDAAVAAARAAFAFTAPWRTMDASRRGELIHKFADLLERDLEYISVSSEISLHCLQQGVEMDELWAACSRFVESLSMFMFY